jgi:hypothetical protein
MKYHTAFRWMGKCIVLCAVLAILHSITAGRAFGQGIITGSIGGTVIDPTGAVIPGASVKAVSESSGTTLKVISNAEGGFQISDVPLGLYTITIEANGFGPGTINHVQVVAGNTTSLGKQILKLGSEAETVSVEADAADLINTESPQAGVTIASEQVQSAPITGAMDNLALMSPGVVNTHSDGMSNTNGANFSVNGQRGRSNNSEIDGQTNNDTSIGGPSFFFDNQDAIAEVQVVTGNMGAEYGRNMGAVVNYITKSGSNSFHGSAFEIYTGSWLSSLMQYQKDPQFGFCPPGVSPSTGCTAPTVPRFVQNNWGGTFGGPILKEKLFFFGSTLWSHTYESGVVDTSSGGLFPDTNGLSQLATAFPNNPAVAALTMNGPYSSPLGNPTSIGGTATTIPVTDGTSTATIEVAQYQRTFPTAIFDQEHLGRIDYQATSKDRFYLRYNYQNNPYNPAFYLVSAATAAGGGYPNVNGISHEVGGDWTRVITSTLQNQLRYAFQQSNIAFESGAIPSCTISDFGTCTSSISLGAPLASYGYPASLPQGRFVKVNQVQDNAIWSHGRQTIKFGTEIDYQDSPWGFLPNATGAFNFTPGAAINATYPNGIPLRGIGENSALSNGLTAMLEGISEVSLALGSPTIPFKETDFAFYFQDDWKPMSNLTVNLGVRYEYFGQSVNYLHAESVKRQTGSDPFWDTSLPLSATTVPAVNSNLRNIEPRIGLAYTPSFWPKMVIHAGYSINVDPEFYELFINMATSAPVVNSGNFACDGVTVQCVPSGGLTFSTVQAADAQFLPYGGDPRINPTQTVPTNFHNPMGETYTLGFQYQVAPKAVATVHYVGNHTFGQYQALNTNPDILDVQSAFPGYGAGTTPCTNTADPGYTRPSCSNGLIETYGNTAFSIYNALQTSLTVRNFHGWTGTASYTYSRTIDNVSEFASSGSGGTTNAFAQNPLDTDVAERGVSGNSYPSIWGIQMVYTEPWFSSQHGILGRLLGGYSMNAFYQYNGGQPFNPIQNSYSVVSSPVLADIGALVEANPDYNQTAAEYSFCDVGFAAQFGNPCRPILSNPKAPLGSIGINLGSGSYVDYVSGNPVARSSEHWIWNNQYEAIALNNPFPGVGRNTLRGDSFSDLDMSVSKRIHLTERVSMNLMVSAFNVLNRAYYGTPDPNVEDSAFGGFMSSQYAFGTSSGSAAGGGSYPQGLGNRNVQLTGKITF